jgi:hypothetical protein
MLGGVALELEIAILQHGEVRRELAKGFIWFLSGSNPMMCSRSRHRRLSQARQMAFCVIAHDSIWESTGSSLQSRKAPEAMSLSDELDWNFVDVFGVVDFGQKTLGDKDPLVFQGSAVLSRYFTILVWNVLATCFASWCLSTAINPFIWLT